MVPKMGRDAIAIVMVLSSLIPAQVVQTQLLLFVLQFVGMVRYSHQKLVTTDRIMASVVTVHVMELLLDINALEETQRIPQFVVPYAEMGK